MACMYLTLTNELLILHLYAINNEERHKTIHTEPKIRGSVWDHLLQ